MLVAATSVANASTVYTYTGNNFLGIIDNPAPAGSYTTSMSVTCSFTLQDPLLANLPLTDITADLLGFSFNDGRNTITNLNVTNIGTFLIATGATGNITGLVSFRRTTRSPIGRALLSHRTPITWSRAALLIPE